MVNYTPVLTSPGMHIEQLFAEDDKWPNNNLEISLHK